MTYEMKVAYFLFATPLVLLSNPVFAEPPQTLTYQEERFLPLRPAIHSYQNGSVKRSVIMGRRFLTFTGTTGIENLPPNFIEQLYVRNANWRKQFILAKGKWLFSYTVDCDKETFERVGLKFNLGMEVGVKSVYLDPTAIAMLEKYCPEPIWSGLSEN